MLTINLDTARRFILGKQGLWPGRRGRGLRGTERAMRAMEYLQLVVRPNSRTLSEGR